MTTPVDHEIYLVRDLRRPGSEPEPARYMDSTFGPYWQFFGTDDNASEGEVKIIGRMCSKVRRNLADAT